MRLRIKSNKYKSPMPTTANTKQRVVVKDAIHWSPWI